MGRRGFGAQGFEGSLLGFCSAWVACPSLSSLDATPDGDKDFLVLVLLCRCFQPWAPTLVCSLGFSLLFCKISETPFNSTQTGMFWASKTL